MRNEGRGPKAGPELDALWGAQRLRKAMDSKGFGAFGSFRGVNFGSISGTPDFWNLAELSGAYKGEMSFGRSRKPEEPARSQPVNGGGWGG